MIWRLGDVAGTDTKRFALARAPVTTPVLVQTAPQPAAERARALSLEFLRKHTR